MDVDEIEKTLEALSRRLATITVSLGKSDETIRRRVSNAETRLMAKVSKSSVNEATLAASKLSLCDARRDYFYLVLILTQILLTYFSQQRR